jgi:ribosomal protein S27AE
MDDDVLVVVRMHTECARCGHSEDDTYEFNLPLTKAQPMAAYEPGKCLECGTSVQMHPERTQLRQ